MWDCLGTQNTTLTNAFLKFCMTPLYIWWKTCVCLSARHSHGCLRNQHLRHQPPPLFFSSLVLPITPYHSSSPGLSPSLSLYLGRHPGQIVPLRISLKGCWWSTLPSLSKCAQVHLSAHCLEMDNWCWRSKGEEGMGEEKEDREREIYIFVFQMKEKVYLESLNSFCEVKTRSKNKTKHWTQLQYVFSGTLLRVSDDVSSLYSDRYIYFILQQHASDSLHEGNWHRWMDSLSDCKTWQVFHIVAMCISAHTLSSQ